MSGITSPEPLFSTSRLIGTLSCGYFAMLGVLSSDPKGLAYVFKIGLVVFKFLTCVQNDGALAHVQYVLSH